MVIRKIKQSDIATVDEILAGFDLPVNGMLERANFWVAEQQSEIIGVGGIELTDPIALIRSLAVKKGFQGLGVGKRLYAAIEKQAVEEGILRLYLLTTTAAEYFHRYGFETIKRDIAPIPIQQSEQFSRLCPESAVLMQKSLSGVQGRSKFDSGWYCAESVLSVVAEHYSMQSDMIPGIATGLCSGMGRTCGTCGALTGGILAINLVYGRKKASDSVDQNYAAVQRLIKQFSGLYGTTNCAELLGCDLGSELGQEQFSSKKLHRRCREYTGMAADLSIQEIEKHKS